MDKMTLDLLKKSYKEYKEYKAILEAQKSARSDLLIALCGLEEANEEVIAEYEKKVAEKQLFFSEIILPCLINLLDNE